MFGTTRNPAAAYAQVSIDSSVQTADPHRLILILFDGGIQATLLAKALMAQRDVAGKGLAISKAIDIVSNGLHASLNIEAGGPLAEQLAALYDYITERLLWANLKNDPAALEEVVRLLGDLRSAWAEITPTNAAAA